MSNVTTLDYSKLYSRFHSPVTIQDCGGKCAPYNEYGVPFCCDSKHAVPTAYELEWDYLVENTDLWHLWEADEGHDNASLRASAPDDQVLIECLGHTLCQRQYRSITCRAFPFYPYITDTGDFIGLSYYWEYEDRCWVISNLSLVRSDFRREFVKVFDELLANYPHERDNFVYQSRLMRREFRHRQRAIPLLHRNGKAYKISPNNGSLRQVAIDRLPKFGAFKIAAEMRFSDE